MNRRSFNLALMAGSMGLGGLHQASAQATGMTPLFNGRDFDGFDRIGTANWRVEGGALVADRGNGLLVTKRAYGDFQLHAEFWVDTATNSGIFIRCTDPKKIDAKLCYEVNIFDKRPDPTYGTGAIVDVAKVVPMPKAAGKWNTFEITAQGDHLVVVFNGQKTVDVTDSRLANGAVALQYGSGVIKFRKVQIRSL